MIDVVSLAREHRESHGRPHVDKRQTAAEAISMVRDGDHVAVGGVLYSRTPTALLFEILRQGRQGLTLSRPLTCFEADLYFVTGAAERIMTSWVGIGLNWGLSTTVRRYVEQGLADYEEWSHLGIGLRYKAGAMGVPFLPTLTMLGSDLAVERELKTVTCPYTGRDMAAIPAIVPDVALLHVHRADMYGNIQIDGYRHMDIDMARAARTVIVSAEQIVEPDEILATAGDTSLPHFTVDAVVEIPHGAYPSEMYGLYEADLDHFDQYVAAVKARGDDGVRDYVQSHVHDHATFEQLLQSLPGDTLANLEQRARELMV